MRNQSNPNPLLYQIMTYSVLDKNPEIDNFSDIIKILESNILNLIMHSDPFLKTSFLNKVILATKYPIIYLDFDLLFSGYVTSDTFTKSKQMTLYQPNRDKLLELMKTILVEISKKKSMIIIDSLNGLFNFFHENKDAGRLVNSYIMLFCSIAKNSDSCILISGLTRKKNNEKWVLSITGRHLIETKQMNTIWLERKNSSFIANIVDEKTITKKSYKIPLQSELI